MQEAFELGLWKWLVEHIAVPLLGGMWAALAWWVKMIADKFSKIESQQKHDAAELHARISTMDQRNADTYARQDYVREGFGRLEGKLDILVKHALKDSQ